MTVYEGRSQNNQFHQSNWTNEIQYENEEVLRNTGFIGLSGDM
jgi:hypothetical protein